MRIVIIVVILLLPAGAAAAQHYAARVNAHPTYEMLSRHAADQPDTAATLTVGSEPGGIATHLETDGLALESAIALRLEAGLEDEHRKASVTGGVIGAVVGAAVGTALACFANRDSYGVYCAGQSDTKLVIGGVIGAGIGAYIGAVVIGRRR